MDATWARHFLLQIIVLIENVAQFARILGLSRAAPKYSLFKQHKSLKNQQSYLGY